MSNLSRNVPAWRLLVLWIALMFVGCGSEPNEPSVVSAREDLTACELSFAAAASVNPLHDTHSDLFPAFSKCKSVSEWKAARAKFPDAMGSDDAVSYAMNLCANYQTQLAGTPMCNAIHALDAASQSTLTRSDEVGLLGMPLPVGATLIEKYEGDLTQFQDPYERYKIDANAASIAGYFRQQLPGLGWAKLAVSTDFYLTYNRGQRSLGVILVRDGGEFKLMGS